MKPCAVTNWLHCWWINLNGWPRLWQTDSSSNYHLNWFWKSCSLPAIFPQADFFFFFFLDRQVKWIQTDLGNCPCGMVLRFILFYFFAAGNNIRPGRVGTFTSPSTQTGGWSSGSGLLRLRSESKCCLALSTYRYIQTGTKKEMQFGPHGQTQRRAGCESARPKRKKKRASRLRPHSCCRGDHLEAFK